MFRTRDFVLLFVTIVFLVSAIGVTLWQQHQVQRVELAPTPQLAVATDTEFTAEVVTPESISREERLASLREKIAESGDLVMTTPEAIEVPADEVTMASSDPEVVLDRAEQRCPSYVPYGGVWPDLGVQLEVVEGARLAYQEVLEETYVGTSTTPTITPQRVIYAQLPVYPTQTSIPGCIASDVIGIAQDGSLMRNNEAGLYSVFGSETIIGYALDGFPIRGTSAALGDACGGQLVGGQYAYYLSADRQEILHCFSARPTEL